MRKSKKKKLRDSYRYFVSSVLLELNILEEDMAMNGQVDDMLSDAVKTTKVN